MDKKTVKRYAAYLEIFILFCITGYIIQNILIKYLKRDYKDQFAKNKDNPLSMLTASSAGSSSEDVFNNIVNTKSKGIFEEYLSFLKPVFDIFGKMFGGLGNSVNILRNTLMPIRNYFATIAMMYYRHIEKFSIGILYMMHKFRTALYRSLTGFNLLFHTLEHTKNTVASAVDSRGIKLANKYFGKADWAADKCFDEHTLLKLKNNKFVKICDIQLDDVLEDNSIVIATHKFKNKHYLYKYHNIYVTGSHIVKEKNKWCTISNAKDAFRVFIKPEYIYCISTNTGTILINNILFRDFNESINKYINLSINSIILSKLNNSKKITNINDIAYESKYLDSGFHKETLIEMNAPIMKFIQNIKIGDVLLNNNMVTGVIKLSGKHFKFYNDNSVLVTSNMKTKQNGIWKNIEKTNCQETNYKDIAYHLITEQGEISIYSKKGSVIYRDYNETDNKYINDTIEDIVLTQ